MTVPLADIDYLYGVRYIVVKPSEEDLEGEEE